MTAVESAAPAPKAPSAVASLFSEATKARSDLKGILYPTVDYALYLACAFGVIWFQSWWAKLALSAVAMPIMVSRLFVLGHDLAHRTLAENKTVNAFFGRLVFIPTLHTFSLWELYHNVYHHGFSNVRKKDYSQAPLSPEEYRAKPALGRLIYRIERSAFGHGLWVLLEHILPRMFFPKERYIDRKRTIYTVDSVFVLAANALQVAAWILLSGHLAEVHGRAAMSPLAVILLTFVLPFAVFSWLFGWVIYFQHTGPEVPWYRDKTDLNYMEHQKSVTPDWHFPHWFGWAFHFIHVHTAHHVYARIPAYHLPAAQRELIGKSPELISRKRFTFPAYFDIIRRCKLYDFERRQWCDFAGNPTGPVLDFKVR